LVVRVIIVAILALALMLVLKDGRLTAKIGLVSRCETIATPVGQNGEWRQCKAGLIDGRRNLKDENCKRVTTRGKIDVWRCVEI
jgi:hypothetical protein